MSSRLEEQLRADIVEVGRRMNARGYVASNDGNISARLDDTRLITTPKSVPKGFMTPDMMVIVDYEGKKLAGDRDPSSELPMHLEVYRNRPDVNAVVHAHPPIATGFAVAGIPLTRAVLAEVVTTLGSIPIAEYGTPSTAELPAAVRKYIKAHDGMLLANHGAVTCGKDVMSAYYKMETIEHFAKISLVARHARPREPDLARGGRAAPGACAACTASPRRRRCARIPPTPACRRRVLPGARGARIGHRRGWCPTSNAVLRQASRDGEIRLTYGELTALIADAVKNLRD